MDGNEINHTLKYWFEFSKFLPIMDMAAAADKESLPIFYERKAVKNTIPRIVEVTILFLLFSLLAYRLLSLENHGFIWVIAFVCELWFTFTWFLIVNCKWSPVNYNTYPENLLQRKTELPPVDMFVTTADPELEPPIITMNTVLSLLAVDYPGNNKLACYVSDDAASPVTFYCLVETSRFAKQWVPFCRKYKVPVRAPFRYFTPDIPRNNSSSSEFQEEWKKMKELYEDLWGKIECASQKTVPLDLTGDFAVFENIQRGNHSTIVKVIWDNKEDIPSGLPHLVYISREKRPNHPHHYKAGAMNALTRVSGVMTNAPFVLNVDCDMYAHNPQIVLHAMCLVLGAKDEKECGFVQFPQIFYDTLKDDPFGNQMIVLFEYFGRGISGIQGPFYSGTGCIHRRKVIYGASPKDTSKNGKLGFEDLQRIYGKSLKFIKLVGEILSETNTNMETSQSLSSAIEEANIVAGCGYEYGSCWGKEMGFIYGSATEDVFTGLLIQAKGWKSTWCTPSPSGFLGLCPSSGPISLLQQKRWSTGLLEILFSSKSPLVFVLKEKLQFRQCLAYIWILSWAIRSLFVVAYSILPAFCILNNSHFLPKVNESAIMVVISIFVIYNTYCLSEYFRTGQTVRAWWNNQRMARVVTMTSWLFGFLSVILKLIGLSETAFEVTKKDQSSSVEDGDEKPGRFTFDDSPLFVPGVTILLVNLFALGIGVLGFKKENVSGESGWGIGEFVCSVCVVLCFWAFLKGLFCKGKYGIPFPITYKAATLALLFVHLSRSI